MKRILKRLVYGLAFAIPLMLISYALAFASSNPAKPATVTDEDCAACHQSFQAAWKESKHGQATSDPAFTQEWEKQGKPQDCLKCHVTGYDPVTGTWEEDGITCKACHSPITKDHPLAPMTVNRSARLCGDCHNETYFEWQVSQHRNNDVDCAQCHDPHATALKSNDAEDLCSTCHRSRASNFTHTSHSKEGLSCIDCHLSTMSTNPTEGHSGIDHSFFVSLNTCNSCHAYQMHDPISVHDLPASESMEEMASVEVPVSTDPRPASPVAFTALFGVVGVAFGIVLAPWLDRLQNRARKNKSDEE